MFIEAVLYVARTGIPMRDLPGELGNYSGVYNRLKRWRANGTWEKLWPQLQADEVSLADNLYIDSIPIDRPLRETRRAGSAAFIRAEFQFTPCLTFTPSHLLTSYTSPPIGINIAHLTTRT